jgi:hypothetical protein
MIDVVLDRKGLGKLGPSLGEGGQARVYEAPKLTLLDAPGALVYKEYKIRGVPAHGLRRLVATRNQLDHTRRTRLDELAAWPLRVVEDGGVALGVVMRLIPETFFQTRYLPGTGRLASDPREVQNLFVDPGLASRLGMPAPTPTQRLAICRDLAAAVHAVHRMDLVVGDVNARNALFRLTDRPHVILVDCDAVRARGTASPVSQLNAPDWDPPEGRFPLSQQTDRYKFGLFVVRCLNPQRLGSLSRDPAKADAHLDTIGRTMLRAALLGPPTGRPTLQEWGRYLQARIEGRPSPPWPAPSPVPAPRPPTAPTGGMRRDATGVWQRVP